MAANYSDQLEKIREIGKALAEHKKALGEINTKHEESTTAVAAQIEINKTLADFLGIQKDQREAALQAEEKLVEERRTSGELAGEQLKFEQEILGLKERSFLHRSKPVS